MLLNRVVRGRLRDSGLEKFGGLIGPVFGLRRSLESNEILIRNFPTEVFLLPTLQQMLLKKNGTTGIGDENSGSREHNISGAILDFDLAAEKRGVARHTVRQSRSR